MHKEGAAVYKKVLEEDHPYAAASYNKIGSVKRETCHG